MRVPFEEQSVLREQESPISSPQAVSARVKPRHTSNRLSSCEFRSDIGAHTTPQKRDLHHWTHHAGCRLLKFVGLALQSDFSILGSVRAVIQRVSEASVKVEGETIGSIGRGLMVLIAAGPDDQESDAKLLADKIANLRIFCDAQDKMNLSLLDIGGELLGISQFTLFGDARKGRRPSFLAAMEPAPAEKLYERVLSGLRDLGVQKVACGRFGADMKVALVNDGPVTILLDTKKSF